MCPGLARGSAVKITVWPGLARGSAARIDMWPGLDCGSATRMLPRALRFKPAQPELTPPLLALGARLIPRAPEGSP
eukprot:15466036-Alexandrium_andersonii.AAC.1